MIDRGTDKGRLMNRALFHIESILKQHAKTLESLGLPKVAQIFVQL